MTLPCEKEIQKGYVSCLMQYHSVPYMIPYETREVNGECELYYRLMYRTTLKTVLGHLQLNEKRITHILECIVGVLETAEDFLFSAEMILWNPEYVFIEADTGKLSFCYYPDSLMDEKERGNLKDLIFQILQGMDKRDEQAVFRLRSFYHLITESGCTLQDLKNLVRKPEKDILQNEKVIQKQAEIKEGYNKQESREPETGRKKNRKIKKENINQRNEKKQKNKTKEEPENVNEEPTLERIIKWIVVGLSVWNIILIILLICNVLTYEAIRYLIGSMGILIVMTIIYMNISKEETPDEMMQHYFEQIAFETQENTGIQNPNRYDSNRGIINENDSKDMEMKNTDHKNIEKDTREEWYGETCLLQMEECDFEKQIVKEEKSGPLILSSFMKEKYPAIHIDTSTVIGCMQAGCNYLLKERGISRMHAKIMNKPDGLFLLDLNSTNGTYLNGTPLESGEEYLLEEGDVVAFAKCEFFVEREY